MELCHSVLFQVPFNLALANNGTITYKTVSFVRKNRQQLFCEERRCLSVNIEHAGEMSTDDSLKYCS